MTEQSPEKNHKTEAICPAAKKCGGCDFQGTPYEKQLAEKEAAMRTLFAGLCPVEPIIGMEEPLHYRNKVHHVLSLDKNRRPTQGIYEEGSHRVVNCASCMLEDELSGRMINEIFRLLKSFKITVYDEDSDFGLLRHVLVRRGFQSGEVMVVLVVTSPIFPSKNNFVKALRKSFPEITTVVLNVNDRKTSMVLGNRNITLYGPGFIYDTLCGLRFRLSPDSFYQSNSVQTEKLYETAMEFAELSGKETVLDAYCGIGTIGLTAAKKAGRVIGVELNPNAVKDAINNAKGNHIENAAFFTGDASDFMVKMAERGEKCDVVFLDPPRSGSTETFIHALKKLGPSRVVYISCGPDTQRRDIDVFQKDGYRVERIRPVDMFPFTRHVETVCLLSKLSSTKHHVGVEFNLDEMDLTTAESKATYDEIREYVMAQTGLHVTNLNIAQIKRKCRIIERENNNLPKSEDSRQPNCTKEKEAAIKEALKHFGMI